MTKGKPYASIQMISCWFWIEKIAVIALAAIVYVASICFEPRLRAGFIPCHGRQMHYLLLHSEVVLKAGPTRVFVRYFSPNRKALYDLLKPRAANRADPKSEGVNSSEQLMSLFGCIVWCRLRALNSPLIEMWLQWMWILSYEMKDNMRKGYHISIHSYVCILLNDN